MTTTPKDFEIRPATEGDAPLILDFIKKLAVYEKLAHKVTATEDILRETLFGERRYAEVIIGYHLGNRSDSRSSSTTTRPSWASRASTWKTCLLTRSIAARASERRC